MSKPSSPRALRMLVMTYAVSWTVAFALWKTGGIATPQRNLFGGFLFMLGPAVAALLMTKRMTWPERREVLGLRMPTDRWVFFAWLIPAAIVAITMLGSVLIPGTHLRSPAAALHAVMAAHSPTEAAKLDRFPAPLLSALLILQAFAIGPLVNAPLMLSEELGWRGYLWSEWRRLGFVKHALATGAVWGLWHAPLVLMGHNYPDTPVAGVGIMTIFCIVLAPVLHWVRERGGSVVHACVFHGTINASATLGALCIQSPTWVGRGIIGLPGLVTLAVASAIVMVKATRSAPTTNPA